MTIEFRILEGFIYYVRSFFQKNLPPTPKGSEIDSDVEEERNHVLQMTMSELTANRLVLKNFSKFYGHFLAVNQLSVAIGGYVQNRLLIVFKLLK